ncbi:unnamed protein product [Effrenium voratum]|nr:unnamed protein product [Effrenium voratum]
MRRFLPSLLAPSASAVVGVAYDGGEAFLGLRYARSPRRFAAAELTELQADAEATRQGPRCWSPDDFPCVPTPGNLPSEACKSPQAAEMSEDCLFLDIYRPSGGSWPKAVMVWIHGGGMTLGDSGGGVGNGTSLSGQDVIVVSINYRLGPLGFLPLRPFGAATGTGGMNGLHDQIQALRWIQRYIGAFGGDAKRVTLFGCSAGSLSICTLAVSPLAKGLFHQAVLQSGPCLGPWGPGTVEEGEEDSFHQDGVCFTR